MTKGILTILAFSLLCDLASAVDPWDEPLSPHSSDWWFAFTISNAQKYAASPIKTNAVRFIIINGQGFHSMNPWVVRRTGVEPQRLPPLSHPDMRGCEIRLQSDAAVDFLCQAPAVTLKQTESIWSRPTWFMAFCQASNVVVGFKIVTDDTFLRMPDARKAIDNNGEPLSQSRPGFVERLREKEPANLPSEGTR